MRAELDKELFDNYKELFAGMDDLKQSLMGFGFEHGDGWYVIVKNLCQALYDSVKHQREGFEDYKKHGWKQYKDYVYADYPTVVQVKEKFGGLRFYLNFPPMTKFSEEEYNKLEGMISFAENYLSYSICEDCGKPGECRNDLGWIRTLCNEHYEEVKKK
jgi:hypothetical protein